MFFYAQNLRESNGLHSCIHRLILVKFTVIENHEKVSYKDMALKL